VPGTWIMPPNGGKGGTTAKATPAQLAAEWENHIAATSEQSRHAEAASKDPALSLSRNHGYPAVAAASIGLSVRAAATPGPLNNPTCAVAFAPRPISRYPQITWSRNRRLIVDGQWRRRLIYADAENQLTIGCAQRRQGAWSKEDSQNK
jgi:hypothetical protein